MVRMFRRTGRRARPTGLILLLGGALMAVAPWLQAPIAGALWSPAAAQKPTPKARLGEVERAIVDRTNAIRKERGLEPLDVDRRLIEASEAHAERMARREVLTHELGGTTLGERVERAGYEYAVIAENIASGQQSPEEVLESWMESPGHRENLLDPRFSELGVGVARDAEGRPYYVQVFGRPREGK